MKSYHQLLEGIYDPNIFKAIFLAGGPGSGKSFVVKRAIGGLGLKIINSDDPFERYLKTAGLDPAMPESEKEPRDAERARAKRVTGAKQGGAILGRLGLIIDGTGKDYAKIQAKVDTLRALGYDCSMVFVNTSLETALKRNQMRARKVSPQIAEKGWKAVQSNLGKFQMFFGPDRFFIVDNNDHNEDLLEISSKAIARAIRKPVRNHIATAWIAKEKEKRSIASTSNLGRNVGKGGGGYVPKTT